jgi:hypothetical protein
MPLCGISRFLKLTLCLVVSTWVLQPAVHGQDLVQEAVAAFPLQTVRLEYSKPAVLRTLPDYNTLRQRYVGPNLRALEEFLAKLGVQERDIDELVLGWQKGEGEGGMVLEGVARGRFDPRGMASRAASQGIEAVPVQDATAYCFGSGPAATCVAALDRTRGIFGPLAPLTAMIEARAAQSPTLSSDSHFMSLLHEAQANTPIWGVALGAAISDWFKGWMPSQKDMQLDWSQAFQRVQSLSYRVQTADKVHLDVTMTCDSAEAATQLGQVLQGLKLFQQLAWQQQNPNRPNPFEDATVAAKGQQVSLALVTPYTALEGPPIGQ